MVLSITRSLISDLRFQIGLWFLAFGLALGLGVHTTKGQKPKAENQRPI
jgi:hypothetical protein